MVTPITFLYGFCGGLLIGVSAAALLLFSGDILGASGIVSSLAVAPQAAIKNPDYYWRWAFLASFCLASNLFFAADYEDVDNGIAKLSPVAYGVGGLLVGFGTKLGSGCTSGHGICGLARFSKRSLASVVTFMCVGILTTYLTQESTSPFPNHASFLRSSDTELLLWPKLAAVVIFIVTLVAFAVPSFHESPTRSDPVHLSNSLKKLAPSALSGALFSIGLFVSQMVYPSFVFGFLNLGLLAPGGDSWDPTLMFVMGGGVMVSFLSYQCINVYSFLNASKNRWIISKPIMLSDEGTFHIPTNDSIDVQLIVGGLCFGLGWGITGLCPGPAIFLACIGVSWILVCYWPAFLIGSVIASQIQSRWPSTSGESCCDDCPQRKLSETEREVKQEIKDEESAVLTAEDRLSSTQLVLSA